MKICFFIDDITKGAGTERCTVVLSNLLAKKGNEITILSINASKDKIKYELASEVKVKKFNQQKIKNTIVRKFKTYRCLKKEIADERYDIIVVVDTYKTLCFIPVFFLLKNVGTKLISWEHFNFDFGKKYSPRWWGRIATDIISDAIVVLSDADMKMWKDEIKYPEKIRKIYNFSCFKPEKPKFDSECKTVLAVGRLETQKGYDYLLDIWKKIEERSDLVDWKLRIVGSGSCENELHAKEKQLSLKRVEWSPFTSEIRECYRNASIYVMSSREEGFALVLLEAKAFGLPIVSFDIKNGPNEIIQPEVNGFLIPPFEIDKFAEKLSELMADATMREKFTNASQDNIECFAEEKIIKQWLQLFKDVKA